MKTVDCSQVRERLADHLGGELAPPEHEAIEVHLAVCEECREQAEIWAGLEAVVAEAPLPEPYLERRSRRARTGVAAIRARQVAAVCAVAAAVLVAGLVVIYNLARTGPEAPPSPLAVRPLVSQVSDTIDRDVPVRRGGRRVIEISPGTALWLDDDAVVSVEESTERMVRFRLERGYVLADVGTTAGGFRFVVATPEGEVEARGTVFSVDVSHGGGARVRVVEGLVEVRRHRSRSAPVLVAAAEEVGPADGTAVPANPAGVERDVAFLAEVNAPGLARLEGVGQGRDLDAGASPRAGLEGLPDARGPRAAAPAEEVPAAERAGEPSRGVADEESIDLYVKLALEHRRKREFDQARAHYIKLIGAHPGSRAAANSLVTLGQMELTSMGRPGDALGHFASYLSGSSEGVLAEEARAGRVRALAQLGRTRDMIVAAAEYLGSHPGGRAAAEMLRRRADGLRKLGDCDAASGYYSQLVERWPGSREAEAARIGLEKCGGRR